MLHMKWYNLHYMISKYEPSWAILQAFNQDLRKMSYANPFSNLLHEENRVLLVLQTF
jgi:hypothetical protein